MARLSIKHFVCCGMDVHKKFVVATIAFTDFRGVTTYKKKRFATFNSDLRALKKWLLDHRCTEVSMESTGKYWIPIFNILEDSCHVIVANPKYVRAIKGQKTMIKIRNGSLTFLNSTSFLPAISHAGKSEL
ncbi:transposase [Catenibacillus scindens]|uniref:Transposase n=1 Tax=Catenibacillus scindens TaxID=673271 RepID=A0A7W8HAB2_9FIRM|nr:transposase [Catenibacillus scindens]